MRITAIDRLESGARYRLHLAGLEQKTVEVSVITYFENGWWLFHLEQPILGRVFTMVLVNREGEISIPPPVRMERFTLKPAAASWPPPPAGDEPA